MEQRYKLPLPHQATSNKRLNANHLLDSPDKGFAQRENFEALRQIRQQVVLLRRLLEGKVGRDGALQNLHLLLVLLPCFDGQVGGNTRLQRDLTKKTAQEGT
jgi:hypothetical protein